MTTVPLEEDGLAERLGHVDRWARGRRPDQHLTRSQVDVDERAAGR